jgi:hypothetical protein
MNSSLTIPAKILEQTLEELRLVGLSQREGFVLWLGDRTRNRIKEMYVPEYESGKSFYRITEKGNTSLFSHLKQNKLYVLAQIHTHPFEAFHSLADDKMATVAHVGGLSFVLPDFARQATLKNFSELVKTYQLSKLGKWESSNQNVWSQE